jgi:anti-sigma factor RsiW
VLLRSKAQAALAFTAPVGSLAQGFKAFRAQEIALLAGDQSNWQRFVLRGFFAASVVAGAVQVDLNSLGKAFNTRLKSHSCFSISDSKLHVNSKALVEKCLAATV